MRLEGFGSIKSLRTTALMYTIAENTRFKHICKYKKRLENRHATSTNIMYWDFAKGERKEKRKHICLIKLRHQMF